MRICHEAPRHSHPHPSVGRDMRTLRHGRRGAVLVVLMAVVPMALVVPEWWRQGERDSLRVVVKVQFDLIPFHRVCCA